MPITIHYLFIAKYYNVKFNFYYNDWNLSS